MTRSDPDVPRWMYAVLVALLIEALFALVAIIAIGLAVLLGL